MLRPPSNSRRRRASRGLAQHVELAGGVVQDLLDQVGHEVRLGLLLDVARVLCQAERECLESVAANGGDDPEPDHAVQDVVALDPGLARVLQGVVVGRSLDQAGQRGALGQRELRGRLAEVVLGGRPDPVHAVGQVDLVEVQLEDLVLRVLLLHADGQRQLLELPVVGAVVGIQAQRVLHELLGDGGAALHHLAGLEVRREGADQRRPVERAVAVEVGVLAGQHGLLRGLADVLQAHQLAVVQVDGGQHGLAVAGVDGGALGEPGDPREPGAQRRDLRVEPFHADGRADEGGRDDDRRQARRDQHHRDQQQDRERLEDETIVQRAEIRPAGSARGHGVVPRIPPSPSRYDGDVCVAASPSRSC